MRGHEYNYMETSKPKKFFGWKTVVAVIVAIALLVCGWKAYEWTHREEIVEPQEKILTTATIVKIIDIDELSSYQAVYNGIAKKLDSKDKVEYFVSYEATVNAGFEFSKVETKVDHETHLVTVTIPEVEILGVNVDIGSLDYIFGDKKANKETVSVEAYSLCEEDAWQECQEKTEICQLAQENARNMICALVEPFLSQVFPDYRLEVN